MSDSHAQGAGVLVQEIGDRGMKADRRVKVVPCGPGGRLDEYVPFYFATRSPMLNAIDHGRVPEYQGGQEPMVYFVSDCDTVLDCGLSFVFTDRHPMAAYADFFDDVRYLDDAIDWPLMRARYWSNTDEDPDRRHRRMAEFGIHEFVPLEVFSHLVAMSDRTAADAQHLLDSGRTGLRVIVERHAYF